MRASRAASGAKAGGLSGHWAGWIEAAGSEAADRPAKATPDNNATRPKTIFNPSRMHLKFHGNTQRALLRGGILG
jgi:hypothetical protein